MVLPAHAVRKEVNKTETIIIGFTPELFMILYIYYILITLRHKKDAVVWVIFLATFYINKKNGLLYQGGYVYEYQRFHIL